MITLPKATRYEIDGRPATREELITHAKNGGHIVGESRDGAALAMLSHNRGWVPFASRLLGGLGYGVAIGATNKRPQGDYLPVAFTRTEKARLEAVGVFLRNAADHATDETAQQALLALAFGFRWAQCGAVGHFQDRLAEGLGLLGVGGVR